MPGNETREDSLLVDEGNLSFLSEGEKIGFQVEGETCDEEQIPACPLTCSEETCTGATFRSTCAPEPCKSPASIPTCDSTTCDTVEETSQIQGTVEASAMPQRPRRERRPPVKLQDYTGWTASCTQQTVDSKPKLDLLSLMAMMQTQTVMLMNLMNAAMEISDEDVRV